MLQYTGTEVMEQIQSNSLVKDFKLFAGSTTAHGVNQIFEGRNKFVRYVECLFVNCDHIYLILHPSHANLTQAHTSTR